MHKDQVEIVPVDGVGRLPWLRQVDLGVVDLIAGKALFRARIGQRMVLQLSSQVVVEFFPLR